jgi:hypothetical protein
MQCTPKNQQTRPDDKEQSELFRRAAIEHGGDGDD